MNKKIIGNADVTESISLEEIPYLLETYTDHLEKLFEVNLRSYDGSGSRGHTTKETAIEFWNQAQEEEQ
ncbi:hypothetical protein [Leuconostoc falkenbergense]|uniref:hypothetical protein n=1 Tax=Leuconostoc falkenbergense TaxID=2766470 RepID=UPI0021AA9EAB|nr:hypothetical protein [Leuconostoc falkenbergense]MCT4390590.1 hypothetical protein [Leuconostoc falkenbergense]